jgi:acyl-coenzyme A thioesterase PaaI-like protein
MAHAVLTVAPGAATAALEVSFQKPTRTDREVLVSARVEERKGRIVKASGSLSQEGETRASARGTFLIVVRPPGDAKR